MTVQRIEALNFRNLLPQVIDIDEKCTLFYGDNGQGKTNILETVWLISCGKSFRANQDKEMIAFEKEDAKVTLLCKDEIRENKFEAILHKSKRKEVFIDGEKITKNADLLGNLVTVLFVPDHLSLIKGSPENRRRFLDISLCHQSRSYFNALKEYNKILEGRNSLLKQIAKREQPLELLDIWDEALLLRNEKIVKARSEYINKLSPLCERLQSEISDGKENTELLYQTNSLDINEIKFLLRDARENDIYSGNTSIGCHRDDMDIILNGMSLKRFGSEGQKRSAVISLKLSEGQILKDELKISPVFLLDDVLSELDSFRREYILSKINNFQVIITDCTEREGLKDVMKYKVCNGVATLNE